MPKSKRASGQTKKAKQPGSAASKKKKESPPPSSTPPSNEPTLLDQLGDTLLAVGAEAERLGRMGLSKVEQYGKLGITKAELEKEKLFLARAYADLGKAAAQAWEESPGSALHSEAAPVAGPLKTIRACRERIDQLQKWMDSQ